MVRYDGSTYVCKYNKEYMEHGKKREEPGDYRLPVITIKTLQNCIRVFDVLLGLFPHVENGTIFTRAENILLTVLAYD